MVRRWSCVINLTNNFGNFKKFNKSHKIILFKTSVNFKRFSFKFTKFKRKSLMRLKHRSTFLIYTNILKHWVKDFLFCKLYLKYQFFNKIFINNFFFYNFNFIKSKSDFFFYNFNFIFTNLNNKNFSYFFRKPFFLNNLSLTTAWLIASPNLNETIIPVYNHWQDSFFALNDDQLIKFEINDLFNLFFLIFLQKNIEIRKIITILIFNKINLKS